MQSLTGSHSLHCSYCSLSRISISLSHSDIRKNTDQDRRVLSDVLGSHSPQHWPAREMRGADTANTVDSTQCEAAGVRDLGTLTPPPTSSSSYHTQIVLNISLNLMGGFKSNKGSYSCSVLLSDWWIHVLDSLTKY